MKILIYEWKNIGIDDLCEVLTLMGHTYKCITDESIFNRSDAEFDKRFQAELDSCNYDCIFTYNFSPVISNNCNKNNIPYIAYVYDSPLIALYSYTIINPCNYVFIFDKQLYIDLKKEGINTVYYLPLPVNVHRIRKMLNDSPSEKISDKLPLSCEISFVGSMYNEKHNLFDRFTGLSPYTKGYLDAIMDAQLKVYGYFFIEELLNGKILADMKKSVPVEPNKDGVETIQYIYAYYFIARKLANIERTEILGRLSEEFNVSLFTYNKTPELPKVNNKGAIDYYLEMPYIFNRSKINLNISLRSIRSGIPMRCMDILGSEGFLISNYQEDFLDFFTPGKDLILYDSYDDLINKCRYYLSHEKEREQICANGYEKVCENHTYEKMLSQIFNIVF